MTEKSLVKVNEILDLLEKILEKYRQWLALGKKKTSRLIRG